jgi:hypothetical protein
MQIYYSGSPKFQRYFDQPKLHQMEPCETCKQVHSSKICPGLVVSASCSQYSNNANRSSSVTHAASSVSIRQMGVLRVSFAFVAESVAISRESATLQEKCFTVGGARSAIHKDITPSTALYNGGCMSTAHPRNAMLNSSVAKHSRCSSATIQPANQSIPRLISQLILTATIALRRVI